MKDQDPAAVLQPDGLLGELKKALAERRLNAELDAHLDSKAEQAAGNNRNGHSRKTVRSEDGELGLSIPRDRYGRFDPALIPKYQRQFPGFDQKIIALYAHGMSTRDIQAHIQELCGVGISPDLVSVITDAVMDEVRAWQARSLESNLCAGVNSTLCGSRSGARDWGGTRPCTWPSRACTAGSARRSARGNPG